MMLMQWVTKIVPGLMDLSYVGKVALVFLRIKEVMRDLKEAVKIMKGIDKVESVPVNELVGIRSHGL